MGHSHDHAHDKGQYYLEQLFTIGACGAFALVTLVLWYSGALKNMLADKFHIWVFLGGAALLAMVLVNGVALWFSASDAKAVPAHDHDHHHDHDHDHDHDHVNGHSHDHAHCDHDHHHDHGHVHTHDHGHAHEHRHAATGVQATAPAAAATGLLQQAPAAVAAPVAAADHGHSHGHDGHDHGWAPWRYAVLLLPVAIYFVVPLEALSSTGGKAIDVDVSSVSAGDKASKGEDFGITFQQLELAALYPENRSFYEGKTVRLVGQLVPKDARMFTLRRFKISCCAADAVPLNAVILIDPKSKETLDMEKLQGKWVQVTGRVEFLKRADGSGYTTTLILTPTEERPLFDPSGDSADNRALVKETSPPSNPYLN